MSGAQITQLGPGAWPMRRYGSFAGKQQAAPTAGFMPDGAFVEVVSPSGATITEVVTPSRGTILDE